jgi:hypothetical protein
MKMFTLSVRSRIFLSRACEQAHGGRGLGGCAHNYSHRQATQTGQDDDACTHRFCLDVNLDFGHEDGMHIEPLLGQADPWQQRPVGEPLSVFGRRCGREPSTVAAHHLVYDHHPRAARAGRARVNAVCMV